MGCSTGSADGASGVADDASNPFDGIQGGRPHVTQLVAEHVGHTLRRPDDLGPGSVDVPGDRLGASGGQRAPVFSEGTLVGIVSPSDVTRVLDLASLGEGARGRPSPHLGRQAEARVLSTQLRKAGPGSAPT